ncbi:MAG: Mrp/NBP35 family ATP-binding protein [Verrucomicrobiales bacterium]|nr:Mrp/NBP35 family ATP-binding protein [Verrucomicrobiales bacterium]
MITEELVREKLQTVNYPGFSRDIVSFGLVKSIEVKGNDVEVQLSIATREPKVPQEIHENAQKALGSIDGIGNVSLNFDIKEPAQPVVGGDPSVGQSSIPGVKKIIAVASGKGGVGKSTVSVNLAVSLAQTGAKVGLCDCDLYGPSVALMVGKEDAQPMATEDNEIVPIEAHGIKTISMGYLLQEDSAVIVRGPLATRYIQQFLRQSLWEDLDYLILDLPPGTGDIQLTISQTVAVDGAIIVTTPQEVALIDARKASAMFRKVNIPILGLVENMSWFECAHGERYDIFGHGGGTVEANRLGVPLLGEIPLDVHTRERADSGVPVCLMPDEESPVSAAFSKLAKAVREKVPVS